MKTPNKKEVIVFIFMFFLFGTIFFLFGCTALDPIGDKNVEYVFENISYDSPNSSPNDSIGDSKSTFNFTGKSPI